MTTTAMPVDNGVNVGALLDAREALSQAPEAAQFTWRATCEWVNGTHSRSTVKGFFGLGEEQSHRTTFTFDADHPEIFASEDHGATPVELVLAALVPVLLDVATGRGADLMVYLSIMALLFLCFNLYLRQKELQSELATVVRTLALLGQSEARVSASSGGLGTGDPTRSDEAEGVQDQGAQGT